MIKKQHTFFNLKKLRKLNIGGFYLKQILKYSKSNHGTCIILYKAESWKSAESERPFVITAFVKFQRVESDFLRSLQS